MWLLGSRSKEVEGSSARLTEFQHRLMNELPSAAKIEDIEVTTIAICNETRFPGTAEQARADRDHHSARPSDSSFSSPIM
jgi:hydrogenase maturation factor HypF (carbamoyltransferase family)